MTTLLDLASPQEVAARHARMAAAQEARMARIKGLREAKALIRKWQIRSPEELLSVLQCVSSAIEQDAMDFRLTETRESLSELCVELDSQVNG